jgi:asparagine synthase (glutamine-hydrolysing)
MIAELGEFLIWCPSDVSEASWPKTAGLLPWPITAELRTAEVEGRAYLAWMGGIERGEDVDGGLQLTGGRELPGGDSDAVRHPVGARASVDGRGRIRAACDPMRLAPLYYGHGSWGWGVATDLRLLAALPGVPDEISLEAIYHLMNFACIPTPHTIYAGLRKLPPGSRVRLDGSGVELTRYWQPAYPEDLDLPESELVEETKSRITEAVAAVAGADQPLGTFLSGGTDSSAITGILAQHYRPGTLKAFSIGFDLDGFDELQYARDAATEFGVEHHVRTLGPDDVLASVPVLLRCFDEPFANSSAVASYYCAALAAEEGCTLMVAGDGGDEIFGGNERYAKDFWFSLYHDLPRPLRRMGRLTHRLLAPVDNRLANRLKNFLYRGDLANPERFYTDDAFASEFYEEMLTRRFRGEVALDASIDVLRGHYDASGARSELNRLLYMDLQVAIADNDLMKVNRSARGSGVSVAYPYLSPRLVAYMGRVPARHKVRGARKRYLYKKAVAHVLPQSIRNKRKQGMGMPLGQWFRTEAAVRDWLRDVLLSRRALERDYFEPGFVERLLERHLSGVWDYCQELWTLVMLELWQEHRKDRRRVQQDAA